MKSLPDIDHLAASKTVLFFSYILPVVAGLLFCPPVVASENPFTGLVRTWAYGFEYDDNALVTDERDGGAGLVLRGMYDQRWGWLSTSVALQYGAMSGHFQSADASVAVSDVERSSSLSTRSAADNTTAFDVDRLYIGIDSDKASAAMGRMPVNLSRTFYFSPNDFFSPFSAQTFYREYKPGVDAFRLSVEPWRLTRFSALAVAGYGSDIETDTGWSRSPESDRLSHIFSLSFPVASAELGMLGGHVRDRQVVGGSLQTSLGNILDVRAEGHRAKLDDRPHPEYSRWVAGVGYQPVAELDLRLEVNYQGDGATDASRYKPLSGGGGYVARHYIALGAAWQWSPLTMLNGVWIRNEDDESGLVSLSLVRSLADESDLDLSVSVPYGKGIALSGTGSEFGIYPSFVMIEWRLHF